MSWREIKIGDPTTWQKEVEEGCSVPIDQAQKVLVRAILAKVDIPDPNVDPDAMVCPGDTGTGGLDLS